jgi:hypothetical protein
MHHLYVFYVIVQPLSSMIAFPQMTKDSYERFHWIHIHAQMTIDNFCRIATD